jgi:hypothetical protein
MVVFSSINSLSFWNWSVIIVFWIECLFPRWLKCSNILCVGLRQHFQNGVIPWWGEWCQVCVILSNFEGSKSNSKGCGFGRSAHGISKNFSSPFYKLGCFQKEFMHFRNLVEGTHTPQYLAFTGVHQQSLDEINRIHEKYKVDYHTRLTIIYNKREEILIVTFWLVWCMNLPHVNLHVCLNRTCYVRRSILTIGLVRFKGLSYKSKEVNVVYTSFLCLQRQLAKFCDWNWWI